MGTLSISNIIGARFEDKVIGHYRRKNAQDINAETCSIGRDFLNFMKNSGQNLETQKLFKTKKTSVKNPDDIILIQVDGRYVMVVIEAKHGIQGAFSDHGQTQCEQVPIDIEYALQKLKSDPRLAKELFPEVVHDFWDKILYDPLDPKHNRIVTRFNPESTPDKELVINRFDAKLGLDFPLSSWQVEFLDDQGNIRRTKTETPANNSLKTDFRYEI